MTGKTEVAPRPIGPYSRTVLISKRARLVLALALTAGIAAPGHFVRPVAASPSDSDPDDAPDVAPPKAPQPSVARRPTEKVLEDVRQGYVSVARAQSEYGVAVDLDGDEPRLDLQKTQDLRGKKR